MHYTTSMLAAAILAVSAVTAYGFASVVERVGAMSDAAPESVSEQSDGVVLAQALTAAINRHDVEEFVGLFTEEDGGPTLVADRFAWQKFEIALWAQEQVRANVVIEAYNYQATENGATWDANVYRDDWVAIGISPLAVTNSVWVHHGKLANFTSVPRFATDAQQLGDRWRPAASARKD